MLELGTKVKMICLIYYYSVAIHIQWHHYGTSA